MRIKIENETPEERNKNNLPKECLHCNRKFKTTNALNAHKRFCVIYKGKGAEI